MLLARLRRWICMVLLVAVTLLSVGATSARAAEESGRKLKLRVQPVYPDLAKRMKLAGVVKVEVVIAANGAIKDAKVIGGHPVLVESALEAVKRWRYEPGSEETTATVEFRFSANSQ